MLVVCGGFSDGAMYEVMTPLSENMLKVLSPRGGNPDKPPQEYNYERIAKEYAAALDGHMCHVVDWFREDLPAENKDGTALDKQVEKLVKEIEQVPPLLENFIKPRTEPPLQFDEKAQPPLKENVLIFSDHMGYCQGILAEAPEGRIASKTVVTDDPANLTQEMVSEIIGKGFDMIIFACGIDPPKSNSANHILQKNTAVTRLFFYLLKCIVVNENSCNKLCVITRGNFTDDAEEHNRVGLQLITSATLFGMVNTARLELQETCSVHYIDTEWDRKLPFWCSAENDNLMLRLSSEVFRNQTFGHTAVRLLHRGRFVLRQVKSKDYEVARKPWIMPSSGVIAIFGGNGALGLVMGEWLLDKAEQQRVNGFSMQFLSRSMKVSDDNMPRWKSIKKRAEKLGIEVDQMKIDLSSQAAVDEWTQGVTPDLAGIINSAGVLQDQMLINMTWQQCETCFDSKHRPAMYLHDSLRRMENPKLKFLFNFSSTSAYGNMGQVNYSGSNTFLDAIARHRRGVGLPSTTIQWGAWGEVGMAANMDAAAKRRMQGSPMPFFLNKEGTHGLELGLSTGVPYFSVFKFNPEAMFGIVQAGDVPLQCYNRNFSCESVPTPPAPSFERRFSYNLFRQIQGSYVEEGVERLVYNYWITGAGGREESDDEDFSW